MNKIILIMMLILVVGCSSNNNDSIKEITINKISTSEVKNIVDKDNDDYMIIDVRTSEEYNSGHIKNAINIPVDEIGLLKVDKDTKIIVYCKSGARSNNAANILKDKGYINIYDMGGINNWNYEVVGD